MARLRGLRLRARQIVEGYIAGLHRSPLHGFSIEFAEHREYVPGDDLRHVDWKVFGRSDKFYVKQYEDETNLICYLVIDASESMNYASQNGLMTKWEYAQCLAGALSWLVLSQQDAVGLTLFDSEILRFVPAASQTGHTQELIDALENARPMRPTSIGPVLHELAVRLPRRGVVCVISDGLDDARSLLEGLQHLRHNQHDVLLLQILDPAEIEFPFTDTTLFRGMEQRPDLVADPRRLRQAYLDELDAFLREITSGCRARMIEYLLIRTDEWFDEPLSALLARRAARAL